MSSVPENRENFFESSVNQTSTHILISAQEEDIFPQKIGKMYHSSRATRLVS